MRNGLLGALLLVLATSAALAQEELVDNTAYRHWAAFKQGSTAKLAISVNFFGKLKRTTHTQTLKELTATKAVVDVAVEWEGHATAGDPVVILAKVPKDEAVPKPPMGGGTPTKKAEGDEEMVVGDAKYKCHWQQFDVKGGTADGTMKVWTCPDVVGGVVKMQMDIERMFDKPIKGYSITRELVEFKAAG